MRLLLNGEEIIWSGVATLTKLLKTVPEYDELDYCVIVNGRIAPNKDAYDHFILNEGDDIKVLYLPIGG